MDHPKLTPSQSAVLFVLMAQAREVRNPELSTLAPALTKQSRELLNRMDLIESRKQSRTYIHALTDRGWAWCAEELGSEPPERSLPPIRALYAVLAGIGRHLDAADLRLYEVFGVPAPQADTPNDAASNGAASNKAASNKAASNKAVSNDAASHRTATPPPPISDVPTRIRAAYRGLAPRPGGWVGVHALRAAVTEIPRTEVDAALVALQRLPGISLIPQEDQMLLTSEDRADAVLVGSQPCHLFAIEDQ